MLINQYQADITVGVAPVDLTVGKQPIDVTLSTTAATVDLNIAQINPVPTDGIINGGANSRGLIMERVCPESLVTGYQMTFPIDYNATITGWQIFGDVSGSATVDFIKTNYNAYPTGNSICNEDRPTLAGQQKSKNDAPAWQGLAEGDLLMVYVTSASPNLRRLMVIVNWRIALE